MINDKAIDGRLVLVEHALPGCDTVLVFAPSSGRYRFFRSACDVDPEELEKSFPADSRVKIPVVRDFEDLTSISILPTHRCNLRCTYCYSAQGRCSTSLDMRRIEVAIDHFLATRRNPERAVRLTVLGGGEPLLEKDLTLGSIEYAFAKASSLGMTMSAELVTNGSLIDNDVCRVLSRHSVDVGVSYEILPDVQEMQRGKAGTVVAGIRLLCQRGLHVVVQSTITKCNVGRMREMAEVLIRDFPLVKMALFEPVVSPSIFPDAREMRAFHQAFEENFFAARDVAGAKGVEILCRSLNNLRKEPRVRGCEGRFCVVPDGHVTSCFCTSSPGEERFGNMSYGFVDRNHVVIDGEKAHGILGRSVDNFRECATCFLKWHCAGGCELSRCLYDDARRAELCGFTRRLAARYLWERRGEGRHG